MASPLRRTVREEGQSLVAAFPVLRRGHLRGFLLRADPGTDLRGAVAPGVTGQPLRGSTGEGDVAVSPSSPTLSIALRLTPLVVAAVEPVDDVLLLHHSHRPLLRCHRHKTYAPWLLFGHARSLSFFFYTVPAVPFMCLAFGAVASQLRGGGSEFGSRPHAHRLRRVLRLLLPRLDGVALQL
jgi:hypothetical protein